jgi:hypothetical protein
MRDLFGNLLAKCEFAALPENGVAVDRDAQARVARTHSMVIGRASPDARERIPTDPGMRLAVRFLN